MDLLNESSVFAAALGVTPGACVIKLFTAVIDYRGNLLPRYRIPRYFFLFDVIKTFKKKFQGILP